MRINCPIGARVSSGDATLLTCFRVMSISTRGNRVDVGLTASPTASSTLGWLFVFEENLKSKRPVPTVRQAAVKTNATLNFKGPSRVSKKFYLTMGCGGRNCCNIASLTMSALSNTLSVCSLHSEERAISLSLTLLLLLLLYQPRPARNRFRSGNSVRPMHLFDPTFDHDYYFELPGEGERIAFNQFLGVLLHTIAITGLSRVRTELAQLLVIPLLAHHPVQANR